MKKLLLFLTILMVIAGIYYVPRLFDPPIPPPPPIRNPEYQKIYRNISTLEERSPEWAPGTRVGYDSILDHIGAAKTHELIDSELAEKLDAYLHAVYIPILVKAAEDFFEAGCTPPEFLRAIHAEFNRGPSVNQDYQRQTNAMRRCTHEAWYVRGRLNQKVSDYIRGESLDLDKSRSLLGELNRYQQLEHLRQCGLVNESINNNRELLSRLHLADLERQVNAYTGDVENWRKDNFDSLAFDSLKNLLTEYESINYLASDAIMNDNVSPLRNDLNEMWVRIFEE